MMIMHFNSPTRLQCLYKDVPTNANRRSNMAMGGALHKHLLPSASNVSIYNNVMVRMYHYDLQKIFYLAPPPVIVYVARPMSEYEQNQLFESLERSF